MHACPPFGNLDLHLLQNHACMLLIPMLSSLLHRYSESACFETPELHAAKPPLFQNQPHWGFGDCACKFLAGLHACQICIPSMHTQIYALP